ncbi:MAG: SDR family oxidoreductase [Phaeodactylibacter sp.]|nr:SDR family oxidoreductase [Phaeodactylibacter sp.]MCB9266615.1 SDR family oxidoreductase [Lewinellaceae bacterium]MCB9286672.1 SDR family oxidoreductase [Lewinellaceae bacterium]
MSHTNVALITGGSSGIGYAIAHRFIREGFRAIITGRNEEKLEAATRKLGNSCEGIPFNMNCLEKIPEFVEQLKSRYGAIGVLVNNAGINQKKPLVEVTDEDYNDIILTNQAALFALTREVAKVMLHQESGGAVINISSMAANHGIPKVVSYSASKAALEGMTRAMAVDLSPYGIRVNSVAPGFIETPMSSKALNGDPERKARVMARTPMKRMGQPEDIANAVYFLASAQAAFITGQSLNVDGGYSIGF